MARTEVTADKLNSWLISRFKQLVSERLLERPDIDLTCDPLVRKIDPDANPIGANWTCTNSPLHISSNVEIPGSHLSSLKGVFSTAVKEALEEFALL